MTNEASPGGASGARDSLASSLTVPLDAEHAHEFGREMSQTERDALNRRALRQLGDGLELMLRQAARRFLAQTFAEALPGHWLKRAEALEQVHTAWADEAAKNARRHAWLLSRGLPRDVAEDLDSWLAEVDR